MPHCRNRGLIAAVTAMLFVLSMVAHGFVVGGMIGEAGLAMRAAAADMVMSDGGMDCCPGCSCDAGTHMACFAHCAALTGIVTEPASLQVVVLARAVPMAPADTLTSVYAPPDPYPPKPIQS
jgi:hypothetical protein